MTSTKEFDDLLNEIKNNPEILNDTNRFSDEDILKLSKGINPYSTLYNTNKNPDIKKVVLMSHTNMREDYIRRFTMTSMVGFVYRMADEYTPDPEKLVWTLEDEGTTEKLHKETIKPYVSDKLKSLSDALNQILPDLKTIELELEKIQHKKTIAAIDDEELPKDVLDHEKVVEKQQAALLYGITRKLVEFGQDAERRYPETVKLCEKYDDVIREVNKYPLKIRKEHEREIPANVGKRLVTDFLNCYFEYNPDMHVKNGMDMEELNNSIRNDQKLVDNKVLRKGTDVKDPERYSLQLLKSKIDLERVLEDETYMKHAVKTILESRESYNAFMYILNHSELYNVASDVFTKPDDYRYLLAPVIKANELTEHIPPQDTFQRWSYYAEVNLEELRNVVEAIYHDKPEFDEAIIVYDVVEGTQEEIDESRKKFVNKHGEEVIADIKEIQVGSWALLANYKENRDKIDFLNRNTEILERIFNRVEEDKKIGKDLMKRRVRKSKADNIKNEGPEADIMKEYRGHVKELSVLGAKEGLTATERDELAAAKGYLRSIEEVRDVPDDALKVNVFEYKAKSNELNKSVMYTEAEAPKEDNIHK